MAKAFKRKGDRFVARLDDVEREVVIGLLQQTREFLAPEPREPTGDPFDDLVATLGVRPLDDPTITPETPPDPALERLLPTAHRDDPALAAEFRRLTEHGLRERKTGNLTSAIAALKVPDSPKRKGSVETTSGDRGKDSDEREGDDKTTSRDKGKGGDKVWLDRAQAQAMVVALTDVRLLLGERLGLRTDDDADALQERLEAASEDDPQLYLAAYYDFMTWLQESLAMALMD